MAPISSATAAPEPSRCPKVIFVACRVALFDIYGDLTVQGDRETVDLVGSVRIPSRTRTADDIADALILGASGLDNELVPTSLS